MAHGYLALIPLARLGVSALGIRQGLAKVRPQLPHGVFIFCTSKHQKDFPNIGQAETFWSTAGHAANDYVIRNSNMLRIVDYWRGMGSLVDSALVYRHAYAVVSILVVDQWPYLASPIP